MNKLIIAVVIVIVLLVGEVSHVSLGTQHESGNGYTFEQY